ncbi:MAG TPA: hypothetical protein VIV60_00280, partial [Polyangiaceae bacterium]
MSDEYRRAGAYVPRAVEKTREYLSRLVEENERLRLEIVKKTAELDSHNEPVAAAASFERENEYLRKMVALLEERLRMLEKLEIEHTAEAAKLHYRLGRLEAQLAEAVGENRGFSEQYHSIERLHGNLMNLYVTGYRLHASLDRQEVISAITETLINLVGSEDFGVYEADASGTHMELVAWFGVEPGRVHSITLGEGELGAALKRGETHVSTAAQPLHAPDGARI